MGWHLEQASFNILLVDPHSRTKAKIDFSCFESFLQIEELPYYVKFGANVIQMKTLKFFASLN